MHVVPETPSLQAQVQALSYQALQDKLAAVRKSLASADERRSRLATNQFKLSEAIRQRERALLLEGAGTLPQSDEQLDQLRAAAEDTRQQLRAIPDELDQLGEVAAALKRESDARVSLLKEQARRHCEQAWKGKAAPYLEAARKVLAEAALAYIREKTDSPALMDVPGWIEGHVLPLQVQVLFREMAAKEIEEAKKHIIKNNNRLG